MIIDYNSFNISINSNLAFVSKEAIVNFPYTDFESINLGIKLSERLMKEIPDKRKYSIPAHVKNILSGTNKKFIIVDRIEILFNPEYDLDILKLFSRVDRNKKIIVVWPGVINDSEMVYSKPQYDDYIKYNLSDREITIIK